MAQTVAAFAADVTTGAAPSLTVNFTDASTNTPTAWFWDFGDGTTSTSQSPSHEYTEAGIYTVVLMATNGDGSGVEVKTDYVTVSTALAAAADPTPTDTRLRQEVYGLVQKLGKTLTFHNNAGVGAGTYNSATGQYGKAPAATTYAYKSAPPAEYVRKFGDTETNTDAQLTTTLPALNLDATFVSDYLRVGMRVAFDESEWRAVAIERIYSGDLITAYTILLGRQSGT